MKKIALTCVGAVVLASGLALADDDDGWDRREAVHEFVTLPAGVRFPEGITANPRTGEIYVATFDFGAPNKLLRYSRHGTLIAARDFGGQPLLGLAFDPGPPQVYIANVRNLAGLGASKIQRIAADFTDASPIEDVADDAEGHRPPATRTETNNPDGSTDTITFGPNVSAPNAMAFDRHGRLYMSDSFQGAIYYIENAAGCTKPCAVMTLVATIRCSRRPASRRSARTGWPSAVTGRPSSWPTRATIAS